MLGPTMWPAPARKDPEPRQSVLREACGPVPAAEVRRRRARGSREARRATPRVQERLERRETDADRGVGAAGRTATVSGVGNAVSPERSREPCAEPGRASLLRTAPRPRCRWTTK